MKPEGRQVSVRVVRWVGSLPYYYCYHHAPPPPTPTSAARTAPPSAANHRGALPPAALFCTSISCTNPEPQTLFVMTAASAYVSRRPLVLRPWLTNSDMICCVHPEQLGSLEFGRAVPSGSVK